MDHRSRLSGIQYQINIPPRLLKCSTYIYKSHSSDYVLAGTVIDADFIAVVCEARLKCTFAVELFHGDLRGSWTSRYQQDLGLRQGLIFRLQTVEFFQRLCHCRHCLWSSLASVPNCSTRRANPSLQKSKTQSPATARPFQRNQDGRRHRSTSLPRSTMQLLSPILSKALPNIPVANSGRP